MNNNELYFGSTKNLEKRISNHKSGKVFTTKKYLPVRLVYYEAYSSKEDAIERERKIKRYGSSWSHLKKRISESLNKNSQGRGFPKIDD